MKKLLFILLFLPIIGMAQIFVNRTSGVVTPVDARLKAGLNFYLPVANDTTLNGGIDSLGAMMYRLIDSAVYIRIPRTSGSGRMWKKLLKLGDVNAATWGNITGTLSNQTDLQNALNAKLNISDTAAMLLPYLRKADTIPRFNPIQGTGITLSGTYPNITFTNNLSTGIASTTQDIFGSTLSGGDLVLNSTTHGTKGIIFMGTSGYDELNNRLGIRTTSPARALSVTGEIGVTTNVDDAIVIAHNANGFGRVSITNSNTSSGASAGFLGINTGGALFSIQAGSTTNAFVPGGVLISTGTSNAMLHMAVRQGYFSMGPDQAADGVTEWLRVISDGYLGLGTKTPSAKLHVVGTGLFTDTLTATTMGTPDSSNRVASTAWVKRQGYGTGSGGLTGSGTTDFISRWTGTTALGNSIIRDNGTEIGINKAPVSGRKLDMTDPAYFQTLVMDGNSTLQFNDWTGGATKGYFYLQGDVFYFQSVVLGTNVWNINTNTGLMNVRALTNAGLLTQSDKSIFSDTAALSSRFSYNTNIGSTFTLHSLVDKNYVDSVFASGSGDTTALYLPLVAYAGAGSDPDTIGIAGLTTLGTAGQSIRINSGGTGFEYYTPSAGVTTMAAIGSSPNANGATISGSTLTLQPASGSFGGVLTTGAQTVAGDKTLTGLLNVTNNTILIDGGAGKLQINDQGGGEELNITHNAQTFILNARQDNFGFLDQIQLSLEGPENYLVTTDEGYMGINVGLSPAAYLDLDSSTTAAPSLRLRPGVNPSSPLGGAIWWTGTAFNIYDGAATQNLLVPTIARGGTGQTTFTTGDMLYASASNTLSKRAIGSTADILTVSGGVPAWTAQSNLFPATTYTPTLTNTTNVAASTAFTTYYQQIGNTVYVWGKVDIDPTSSLASTVLGISLPIASEVGNDYELSGTAFCGAIAGQGAAVIGDVTNNRATLQFVCSDLNNNTFSFHFQYFVIPP